MSMSFRRASAHAPKVPAASGGGRVGVLVQVAATWCVLAAIELILNAVRRDGIFNRRELPLYARVSAASYDLVALTAALLLASALLAVPAYLAGRHGSRLSQRIAQCLRLAVIGSLLLLYAGSWAMFSVIGRFLDLEGVAFWAAQPVQIFYWVDPYVLAAVCAVTVVAAWTLGWWLPGRVSRSPAAEQRRLGLIGGIAVLACFIGALAGELAYGPRAPQGSPALVYGSFRDERAGPFARALGDLRERVMSQPAEPVREGRIRISRRPIVSMADYLATVDHERVNRWNVVLVVVESLRADQLRAYGAHRDVMPTVDALARGARVFTNAYAQASHSSYASLVPISSHYPLRSPTTYAFPKNPTYARVLIHDVLKPLGYRTGVFSSQNEHWQGMINYLDTGHIDRFFHPEIFDGPTYVMAGDWGFANWVKGTKHAGSVDDHETVSEAVRWIGDGGAAPFFLAMNLQNSHVPYRVPDGFPHKFGPARVDFTLTFGAFPRDRVDIVKDLYADSLTYVDAQISHLVEHLQRQGLWDRTIIVITGDHGQSFYEHGFAGHGGPIFDEVMRVPLIVRAPGLPPGIDDRAAQHVDVAPSIFHLLGLPPHPSFQGTSLVSEGPAPHRSIYMVAHTPMAHNYGIVRDGYKLIYDERLRSHVLYDLIHDPGEKVDLAAVRPALVHELADRLDTWRRVQIDYYAQYFRHAREYPPVLED